jgi:hypothetical protein
VLITEVISGPILFTHPETGERLFLTPKSISHAYFLRNLNKRTKAGGTPDRIGYWIFRTRLHSILKQKLIMRGLTSLCLITFIVCSRAVLAQTSNISGTWQLVRQSNCMDKSVSDDDDSAELRSDMHTRSNATERLVTFKDNSSGEESTRILNSKKTANNKKFFYKFNGEMLLILDKKTQTISDSYMVDKFTSDSLIISNASRPCETKIFVKINRDQPN